MNCKKNLFVIGMLLSTLFLFSGSLCAQTLRNGANRLCDLQSDITGDLAQNGYIDIDPEDGGWDWDITPGTTEHSANSSPENTYGATALGLAGAMAGGGFKQRFLMCSQDAYNGMVANPDIDSASDFIYCCFMDWLYNPGFRHLAKERYDAKIAQYGSAQALGEFIRDYRGGSGYDGLIPYDVGLFALAAFTLKSFFPGQGYYEDMQAFGQVIADDINNPTGYFDIHDASEWFYTHGLAWTVLAMYFSQADPSLIPVVKQRLLDIQLPDGSWYWGQDYPDSDYQATAYVVFCLSWIHHLYPEVLPSLQGGSNWLALRQLTTGGWEYWPGYENTEINGEILLCLWRVAPTAKAQGPDGSMRFRMPLLLKPPVAKAITFSDG